MDNNSDSPQHKPAWRSPRRAAIVAAVAATALLAAACPGGEEPPAMMPEPTPPDMMTMMPEPMEPMEPETPSVTAALSAAQVDGGQAVTLTVSADIPLTQDTDFTLAASEGITFGEGEDAAAEATLTIQRGQTRASISVNTPSLQNARVDMLQASITVTAQDGANIEFMDTTLNLTVIKPPLPNITASISPASLSEGAQGNLTLTADRALQQDTLFRLRGRRITFAGERTSLTLTAGQRTASIQFTADPITSNSLESREATISISTASPAVSIATPSLALQVLNGIDIALETPEVNMDGATLRVTASRAAETDITVLISVPEEVFGFPVARIVIPAGQTAGELDLAVSGTLDDQAELSFAISEVSGAPAVTSLEGRDSHEVLYEAPPIGGPPPPPPPTPMPPPGPPPSPPANDVTLALSSPRIADGQTATLTLTLRTAPSEPRLLAIRDTLGLLGLSHYAEVDAGITTASVLLNPATVDQDRTTRISVAGLRGTAVSLAVEDDTGTAAANLLNLTLDSTDPQEGAQAAFRLTAAVPLDTATATPITIRDTRGILDSTSGAFPVLTLGAAETAAAATVLLPFVTEDLATHFILDGLPPGCCATAPAGHTQLEVQQDNIDVTYNVSPTQISEGGLAQIEINLSRPFSQPVTLSVNDPAGILSAPPVTVPAGQQEAALYILASQVDATASTTPEISGLPDNCCDLVLEGSADITVMQVEDGCAPDCTVALQLAGDAVNENGTIAATIAVDPPFEAPQTLVIRSAEGVNDFVTVQAGVREQSADIFQAPVLEAATSTLSLLDLPAGYAAEPPQPIRVRKAQPMAPNRARATLSAAAADESGTVNLTLTLDEPAAEELDIEVRDSLGLLDDAYGAFPTFTISSGGRQASVQLNPGLVAQDSVTRLRLVEQGGQSRPLSALNIVVTGDLDLTVQDNDVALLGPPAITVAEGDTVTLPILLSRAIGRPATLTVSDELGILGGVNPEALTADIARDATTARITFIAPQVENDVTTRLIGRTDLATCCSATLPPLAITSTADEPLVTAALQSSALAEGDALTINLAISQTQTQDVAVLVSISGVPGADITDTVTIAAGETGTAKTYANAAPDNSGYQRGAVALRLADLACCRLEPTSLEYAVLDSAQVTYSVDPEATFYEGSVLEVVISGGGSGVNDFKYIREHDPSVTNVSQLQQLTNVGPGEGRNSAFPNVTFVLPYFDRNTDVRIENRDFFGNTLPVAFGQHPQVAGGDILTVIDQNVNLTFTAPAAATAGETLTGITVTLDRPVHQVREGFTGRAELVLQDSQGLLMSNPSVILAEGQTSAVFPPARLALTAEDITTQFTLRDRTDTPAAGIDDLATVLDLPDNCCTIHQHELAVRSIPVTGSFRPASVVEGETATLTLSIAQTSTQDLTIALTDSQNILPLEQPVTIPAGQMSASIAIGLPRVSANITTQISALPSPACCTLSVPPLTVTNTGNADETTVITPSLLSDQVPRFGSSLFVDLDFSQEVMGGTPIRVALDDAITSIRAMNSGDTDSTAPYELTLGADDTIIIELAPDSTLGSPRSGRLRLDLVGSTPCCRMATRTLEYTRLDLADDDVLTGRLLLELPEGPFLEGTDVEATLSRVVEQSSAEFQIRDSLGLLDDVDGSWPTWDVTLGPARQTFTFSTLAHTSPEPHPANPLRLPYVEQDVTTRLRVFLADNFESACSGQGSFCRVIGDLDLTITNNDIQADLQLDNTSIREGETATLTLTLDRPLDEAATVTLRDPATLLNDANGSYPTAAIAAGDTIAVFTLHAPFVTEDTPIRLVPVGLPPNRVAITGDRTLTVQDSNHITATLSFPSGNAGAFIEPTITLSAASGADVDFTLTDTLGVLGTRTVAVTVPAGETSRQFSLTTGAHESGTTMVTLATVSPCCAMPAAVPLALDAVVEVQEVIMLNYGEFGDPAIAARNIGPGGAITYEVTRETAIFELSAHDFTVPFAAGTRYLFNVQIGGMISNSNGETVYRIAIGQTGNFALHGRRSDGQILAPVAAGGGTSPMHTVPSAAQPTAVSPSLYNMELYSTQAGESGTVQFVLAVFN